MSVLDERRRAVLAAICDAFIPPTPEAGAGPQLHARVASLVEALPDPADGKRLALLLDTLDNPLVNLLLSARPRSVASMNPDARVRLLRGWAESGIQQRRAGFQALKRLVQVAYYAWPADGTSHPMWRKTGYPGPLPWPDPPRARRLPALEVTRDMQLECDVVVAGSGAGGGVAAGVLAEAGRDVIVLEMGENLGPEDLTQVEGDMMRASYLDGGMLMTHSGSMPILAGSCVGGGTVINWTTSLPLRDATRAEWDARSGLRLFSSGTFASALERVLVRLDVNTDNSNPGMRDQLLERGLRARGWHVDVIPRNATGCADGRECGWCGFGCRWHAKNSTAKTYLADAVAAGARIVPRCTVERVLVEAGRAAGVVARVRGAGGAQYTLTVRARAVIAACGAIHSPALFERSGVQHQLLGRGLRLHPVSAVAGFFPERVEPWTGQLQTRHSDQFADLDRGYGTKFETGPMHWGLPASAFGWEGPRQHRADLERFAHLSVVGVLLRDRDEGSVVTGRDGRPRAHYEMSSYDAAHLRKGLFAAAEVLAGAGATELFSLHQPPVRANPGSTRWLERFASASDSRGYDRCRMALISFHQMATCRMGADPDRGVVSESGEAFGLPGLYVADASAFVTSSGVNPMITIMAVADHVAGGIAARW